MGRLQKKNAKGRLDRYYYLAKEKGYRARSSFKILQINEKYGHFLEKSKVVVDLCAAPGSWCQVASQLCPVNSLIIGVDIVPMKSLPKCITFQADITTEDCRSKLRGYLKTWKADTFLHDGAPNVGLNWIQDAYTQSQLVLQALKLAVEHLNPGGIFITKVFRSKDYNNLIWVFKQLFEKVEATKPPASRNVSAEIFVVCKGFKAPKKLDKRLLESKEVFEELPQGPVNNESKVFNPEKKKRKREGYEENDWTLFHPMDIMEWVNMEEDVINTLGGVSKFEFDKTAEEWKTLKHMKQSTKEFFECCKDLKVLGKKDFRMLLQWRKHARDELGLNKEEEKIAEVEHELTEDQRIDKELDVLKERERLVKKRDKRRKAEATQKEVRRMQMNMLTDMQIGIDAGENNGSLFKLKSAKNLKDFAKGKKALIVNVDPEEEQKKKREEEFADAEAVVDNIEGQLDAYYEDVKERRMETEEKVKARLARGDDDEPWEGIQDAPSSSEGELEDEGSDEEDSEDDEALNKLIASIQEKKKGALSQKAKGFFSDDIFASIGDSKMTTTEPKTKRAKKEKVKTANVEAVDSSNSSDSESDAGSEPEFEVVHNEYNDYETDSEDEADEKKKEKKKEELDIVTAEAMTMAHQLATGQKSKKDIMNEGYNRYSFRDKDGLPAWFLEEERKHSKVNRDITKEAMSALNDKMKLLNARPIKKVMEARARKKMRASKRLQKMKQKSELILEDESKSESDKAAEIQRMMHRMSKKQEKPKVTMIVARGQNRGLKGRPKGVRGKYKMVDGVMKHEMRALKRIEKKNKKK